MPTRPLISVIIPFYNAALWLEEAIDSVRAQTYGHWELILVDDGSLQQDTAIAKQYASQYPGRIAYVQHPERINRGVSASRNLGMHHAQGELIAFLDADDCWLPSKLQHQVDIFTRFPLVTMICEASCFWFSWDDATATNELVEVGTPEGMYQAPELMKRLYPLGAGQPPCPSGIIIKKEVLERNGGFDERFIGIYQLYEDQAFLHKVYGRECIYVSAAANNLYRKRADSVTAAANDDKLYRRNRLFFLDYIEDYHRQQGSINPEIYRLVTDFRTMLTTHPE